MAKQVLTVADFATILRMVNDEICRLEHREKAYGLDETIKKRRQKELDEMRKDRMESPYYKSLIHLKESLQSLNIEVETPNIEIETGLVEKVGE